MCEMLDFDSCNVARQDTDLMIFRKPLAVFLILERCLVLTKGAVLLISLKSFLFRGWNHRIILSRVESFVDLGSCTCVWLFDSILLTLS